MLELSGSLSGAVAPTLRPTATDVLFSTLLEALNTRLRNFRLPLASPSCAREMGGWKDSEESSKAGIQRSMITSVVSCRLPVESVSPNVLMARVSLIARSRSVSRCAALLAGASMSSRKVTNAMGWRLRFACKR